MSTLRFLLRSLLVICHLVLALVLCVVINLDFTGRVDADDWARRWLKRLMRIMGIRFVIHGEPAPGGQMIVCNHVSWIDIPLVGAALTSRFVAKSDIQHWPIIGFIARAIGTFFIRRGAGGSKPLLEKLRPHLAQGGSVVIFPEGTTTNGHNVLAFHPRLFQAALDCHAPVQPVALRYGLTRQGEDIAPFIGDDTLLAHVTRMLRSPGLTAELFYCDPLLPAHYADRTTMAHDAEEAIRRAVAPETLFKKPALLELHEQHAKAA
ncbi:MAG: lysophospholipid acyltransferase family protein [Stagnimonas sp.]|nr:lysophospholipid acyltransferase family protein [Stagnimonas sp.]